MKHVTGLGLVCAGLLFVSCALMSKNSLKSLQVVSDKGANDNKITQIDIVFVYSDDVVLPETAGAWFSTVKQRVLNEPQNVTVVTLRIPPALTSEVQLPPRHSQALKVLAYVNFSDGDQQLPLDLTKINNPVIQLMDDHYLLSWRR